MCDAEKPEKKSEEVKKVHHSQHARILKEDDEFWISSEDLNTENSTDDERATKLHYKKKLRNKNRKRSSPNIRIQRPSIPNVPSTSETLGLDNRLLMPSTSDEHHRSTDDSRTSDEEYHSPPPISTECLSKRLSLEDWRPMKGALNVCLEEASGDARKIKFDTDNFRKTMLYNLKTLQTCPVLENGVPKEKPSPEENVSQLEKKTFKFLKHTPEVKEKLQFIKKMDEEINEMICKYKKEREERLASELNVCQLMAEEPGELRNTEQFMIMCNYQERTRNQDKVSDVESEIDFRGTTSNVNDDGSYFIRKNIFSAKEGSMANISFTDEEKAKLAEILQDIDDVEDTEDRVVESSIELCNIGNAFSISEQDRSRMCSIDNQLEKFVEDQKSREKTSTVVKDSEFWKQFVEEHTLKDIEDKLKKLQETYAEDEEKLSRNKSQPDEEETVEDGDLDKENAEEEDKEQDDVDSEKLEEWYTKFRLKHLNDDYKNVD